MNYRIKRSRRKTIGLAIDDEGLLVRAPMRSTSGEIEKVIAKHRGWIDRKLAERKKMLTQARNKGLLTPEDIGRLTDEAKRYIPERVALYAKKLGVRPGRITIRNQKTRWGSCSAKGNLNFNCLLMLTPPEVIDSVVAHELCHLFELNHSPGFYDRLLKLYPDYYEHHAWLKEHGPELMARAHKSS